MQASKRLSRKQRRDKRIPEIDFLRGLAIFLMVLDHLCVDLQMLPGLVKRFASNFSIIGSHPLDGLYNLGHAIETSPWRDAGHIVFVGVFCLLSGICCTFSRNNWKRTGLLFLFAWIIKLAFFLFGYFGDDPSMYIYFGMLDSLFIAHLLYTIKEHFLKDKAYDLAIGLAFVFFTLMLTSPSPYYPDGPIDALKNLWMMFIGQAAIGGDYIHPLPVIALLFIGAFLGKWLYRQRRSYAPFLKKAEPFPFFGRHSALIYLIHQPILAAILLCVCLGLGYRI